MKIPDYLLPEMNSKMSAEELETLQIHFCHLALQVDHTRREPLIKLAQIYSRRGEWTPANFYATASLELPWNGFYGSNKRFYENEPHEILYRAKGWLGDIEGARKHLLKCLEYQRENPEYLRDTQYYFDYAANNIPGWMSFEEQLFLFETAKKMKSVIECGSWKGKSTYAICKSGCKDVTAIDTWEGSQFEPEAHAEAKSGSVFDEFKNNLKEFPDLKIIKADMNEAVKTIPDKSVDMVFIDAGHTYEEVLNDIRKWKSKARILLCGHDYSCGWEGVERAVNEELGGPDAVTGTIWQKWLI